MGHAAYKRKMAKKCQGVVEEIRQKEWNKNPKARKSGEWLKPKTTARDKTP